LSLAAAIDEHERRADAQAAQVHVARARREVLRERIGVVLRARVDREILEHAPDFVRAGRREIVGRDADERRRRVELRRAADVRARHDDLFDPRLLCSNRHGYRRSEQREQGNAKAPTRAHGSIR
jgi:hypothetical protein